MGQQQILILILVTVLVAIASVIAIDTMQESRRSSNEDAIQQDILQIINEAQTYYFKNETMQGGGRSFQGIDFQSIGASDSTANGTYELTGNTNSFVVEGTGTYEGVFLRADCEFNTSGSLEVTWERVE